MPNESERMQILEMIESGQITAEQGIALLQALESSTDEEQVPGEGPTPSEITEVHSAPEPPGLPSPVVEPAPTEPEEYQPVVEPAPVSVQSSPEDLHPDGFEVLQAAPASEEPTPVEQPIPVQPSAPDTDFPRPASSPVAPTAVQHWRKWWMIPVWIGVGLTVLGGLLMYWVFIRTHFSFWFACSWIPFLFGLLVLALAVASRSMRWLHVRIRQAPGEWPPVIAISLPLPIDLAVWFVRTFKPRIPGLDRENLDVMIASLKYTSPDTPFYVEVDEEDSGEHVEVYIG